MKVCVVPVTAFAQNCSVIWCTETRRAAVVDPGGDLERIDQVLAENGLTVEKILMTHAHIDHAGATAELARRKSVPIEGPHRGDQFWIDNLPEAGSRYGFEFAETFTPDRWLEQGDVVTVGAETLEVRHCPGTRPAMSFSLMQNGDSRSWATSCFKVRLDAPIFPVEITLI